jgi:Kef-type K+ transport system membrane component KefB
MLKQYSASSDIPGLIPIALVAMVLLFAAIAYDVGAPHLLGGFVAGIALSRRFFLPLGAFIKTDEAFTQHIQQQMKPIIQLFTPIFFVVVGLSLDLKAVDWGSLFIWVFSLSVLAIAVLAKMAAPWFIKESYPHRIAIGMAMVPRGEVGLIFAELGRTAGIFESQVFAGLVLVIAYTSLASPIWMKWFYQRYADYFP